MAGLLIGGRPLAAQDVSADSSGVLTGTLTGVEDGEPIPYATVSLTGNGRASFADATGAFRLARLVPGTYALRARQIGYAPLDTAVVIDPALGETVVKLRLHRIALRLAAVGIHGRRSKGCVATGVPDSTVDRPLAAIFSQVRENVDRFRILLEQYPFTFSRAEEHLLRRDPGGDSTVAIDTVDYESRARRPYRIGGIIYIDFDAVGRRRRFMYLPNFGDLADPAFLSAHCFTYGGTETLGGPDGTQVIRIDFRPANRISEPDVEGAVYLDAKRFVVRRAVFRMTRPQAANPPVLGLSVTTTFRELAPLVPVFDSVQSVQELPVAVNSSSANGLPGNSGGQTVRRSAIELDRLLAFTFEQRRPGDQSVPSSPLTGPPVTAKPPATPAGTSGAPATVLTGRVVDGSGSPVAGATVGLIGLRDTVITSDSGRFTLAGSPGPRMLLARRLGFEAVRVPVTIVRDRSRDVTITLVRSVPVLPTVTTTAQERSAYRAIGLDKRMRAGLGQYLTYDQIERRQATSLSQLLQGMRGLEIWQNQHQFGASVQGTRGAGSCVSYVIDGAPQYQLMDRQGSTGGKDVSIAAESPDNLISPTEVAAVEVYSSAARPAGFGSLEEHPLGSPGDSTAKLDLNGQQCVLVVIWTRGYLGLAAEPEATGTAATEEPEGTHGRPVFPNVAMCEPEPAGDTMRVLLSATLQSGSGPGGSDTTWSGYVDRVLTAVRRAFVMPSDLPMPVFGYPFRMAPLTSGALKAAASEPSLATIPTLSAVIGFTLDSSGAMSGLRVAASSLSGPADTSVLAAIAGVDVTHGFPPIPEPERSQGIVHFDLILSTMQPEEARHTAVLGRVLVPVWTLRRATSVASGTQPRLAAESDPVHVGTDSVVLEFVVDDRGGAVMSSVRELNAGASGRNDEAARAFRSRVIRALPGFRFDPALIGGCPVPEMAQATFAQNGVTMVNGDSVLAHPPPDPVPSRSESRR
jgi:hypothetical protein